MKLDKLLFILDRYEVPKEELQVFKSIRMKARNEIDWIMIDCYNYGFIQGKRYERARFKRRKQA